MKGLHHSVIEIKDTENTNIDKILVFLKPQRQKIDVATTRKEAQEILQKVKLKKQFPVFRLPLRIVVLIISLLVSTISLLAVIF